MKDEYYTCRLRGRWRLFMKMKYFIKCFERVKRGEREREKLSA
jgi:hypothetical protein